MKIVMGENDICKTCKYKNPLIFLITGIPPSEGDCPVPPGDIFSDDTVNISDCKCYQAKSKGKKSVNPIVAEIVEYLNLKTGKRFRATTSTTIEFINGRLREKYTLDDFKKVIDIKVSEWQDNPKMNKYLNPETLFRPGNFEKYINQKEIKPEINSSIDSDENEITYENIETLRNIYPNIDWDSYEEEDFKIKRNDSKIGKGVVFLSFVQSEILLDEMEDTSIYNYYIEMLADFIIKKDAKPKSHFQTIMKWYKSNFKI